MCTCSLVGEKSFIQTLVEWPSNTEAKQSSKSSKMNDLGAMGNGGEWVELGLNPNLLALVLESSLPLFMPMAWS